MAGKLIYLVYKVTHTAALNYRGYTDPSLMLVPNGGDKKRRQRGKKREMKEGMGRRGEREKEVRKEREKEVCHEASLLPPSAPESQACTSSYLLWGSCALWGTYLCEHVLLPSYMANKLSCFHTFPGQP